DRDSRRRGAGRAGGGRRAERPAGRRRGGDRREEAGKAMALAKNHAPAVIVATVLLAAAGAVVLPTLPSSIYPPLQFPRILIVAHAGILPARSVLLGVTRPLEQAAMEVPGILRVRSRTFRGSAE